MNLLSQFEFRKAIALHWINPEYTKQRKRRAGEYDIQSKTRKGSLGGTLVASSLTMDDTLRATPSKKRRIGQFVNDKALDPISGTLACRLNPSMDHFLEVPEKNKQDAVSIGG